VNIALSFKEGRWKYLQGDAQAYTLSKERRAIIDVLNGSEKPLRPKEVAEMVGKSDGTIRKMLLDMKRDSLVEDTGQGYRSCVKNEEKKFANDGNGGNAVTLGTSHGSTSETRSVTASSNAGNGGNASLNGHTEGTSQTQNVTAISKRYSQDQIEVTPSVPPVEGSQEESVTALPPLPHFEKKYDALPHYHQDQIEVTPSDQPVEPDETSVNSVSDQQKATRTYAGTSYTLEYICSL